MRRHARVPAGEARFLRGFNGGRPASGAMASDELASALRRYLRVQKYVLLGVLVEELVLSPAELGRLHVGGTPDAVRDGVVESGSAAMRLREVCRWGAAVSGGSPLRVCPRPDGELALLEGADVACAALAAGRAERAQLLQPADFVRRAVDTPDEFFGSARGDEPYQSVYCDGEELVAGRRRALYERLALVRDDDLAGRAVLDLGCNIGMNCYLAVELGARAATGVDQWELAAAAARLNGFYGRPCQFVAADLDGGIAGLGRHDTVFVFSLVGHLRSVEGLLRTIDHVRPRAIYVETHRDGDFQGELERLMEDRRFASVEFRGRCESSAYEDGRARRLYRLEVRGG